MSTLPRTNGGGVPSAGCRTLRFLRVRVLPGHFGRPRAIGSLPAFAEYRATFPSTQNAVSFRPEWRPIAFRPASWRDGGAPPQAVRPRKVAGLPPLGRYRASPPALKTRCHSDRSGGQFLLSHRSCGAAATKWRNPSYPIRRFRDAFATGSFLWLRPWPNEPRPVGSFDSRENCP